jgi:hypothetical protein
MNQETHPDRLGSAIRRPRRKVLMARRGSAADLETRDYGQVWITDLFESIFERSFSYDFNAYFDYVYGQDLAADLEWASWSLLGIEAKLL